MSYCNIKNTDTDCYCKYCDLSTHQDFHNKLNSNDTLENLNNIIIRQHEILEQINTLKVNTTKYNNDNNDNNDSIKYYSNSGLNDYNMTSDNIFHQEQHLPENIISKTIPIKKIKSIDSKKENKIIKPLTNIIPVGISNHNGNNHMFLQDDNNIIGNYQHQNLQEKIQIQTIDNSNNKISHHDVDTNITIYQQQQEILEMLNTINQKMNMLEHNYNTSSVRNMHDIILYILIGMMISFILYIIINKISK